MNSLFSRILLWFLAMVAVMAAGLIFTTAVTLEARQPGRLPPVARTLPFLLGEARAAYERGGQAELRAFLERVESAFGASAFLADARGLDLLTGEDRNALIAEARRRPGMRRLARNRRLFGVVSPAGDYRFVLLAPAPRTFTWEVLAPNLWLIAAVLLFCYGLARYLTRPLRELQGALERFGRGDLAARAGSARRDELGQLAQAFDRMAGRIQTLVEAEKRLLLDISHELRSPLARLGVAVELARTSDDPSRALDRIEREAGRLNALVTELLELTRAEADPARRRREPVRLHELLEAIAADVRMEARGRGTEITLAAPCEAALEADPELLRRAIENLLRNAIRYAPEQTAVEIACRRAPGAIRLEIRDYGPGVPAGQLARIFDAFYRVDPDRDRSRGGAGLGLAIARRAVELHGGKIWAENADPGLRVCLELPATTLWSEGAGQT